jgi:hypothetical protein
MKEQTYEKRIKMIRKVHKKLIRCGVFEAPAPKRKAKWEQKDSFDAPDHLTRDEVRYLV